MRTIIVLECLLSAVALASEGHAEGWEGRKRPLRQVVVTRPASVQVAPVEEKPNASVAPADATPSVPQVDHAEVLRLGDMVQHVGVGPRASSEVDAFARAMGPPASDADKWFISVLSMRGCAGCEKLKRDFATDPWLRALADPADPKLSWSHYNVYLREDASQSFRFENLRITAYPTVIVQPPRSGRYGDPSTVVYQGVYGGDPQRLARDIAGAIRKYVGRLQPAPGPVRQTSASDDDAVGADPPWQPAPKVDPWQPQPSPLPVFPPYQPQVPPVSPEPAPAPTPVPAFPWTAVISLLTAGFSLPAAIAIVAWLIYVVRARRQAAGKPVVLDQTTLDQVLVLLKQLAEAQAKKTQPQPPQS